MQRTRRAGANTTKTRRLRLTRDTPAGQQSCIQTLSGVDGVEAVHVAGKRMFLRYDLDATCFKRLRAVLEAGGDELHASLYNTARMWLWELWEAIESDNLAFESGWDTVVREIYMSRYTHRRHGRRDDRQQHWRKYAANRF